MTFEQKLKALEAKSARTQRLATGLEWMFIGFVLGCALATVGNMDFEDHKAEADLYCKMVHEGSWPDYNQSYKQQCREGKSK